MLRSQILGQAPHCVICAKFGPCFWRGIIYLPVLLPLMQAYRWCTYSEGLSWRLIMCWHYSIHNVLLYSSWGLCSSSSLPVKHHMHHAGLVSRPLSSAVFPILESSVLEAMARNRWSRLWSCPDSKQNRMSLDTRVNGGVVKRCLSSLRTPFVGQAK